MARFSTFAFFIFVGLLVLPVGCKKDKTSNTATAEDFTSTIPRTYFDLALKLTKEGPGFTPPVAARAYGYTSLALYEAVVPGISGYQSLQGQLSDFVVGSVPAVQPNLEYNWEIVSNAVLADMLRLMYRNATAANLDAIANLEHANYTQISANISTEVADRSVAHGRAVANAIWKFSATDTQEFCYNSNFPASFVPPTGPGAWIPTPPAYQKALQPYWGSVRPFLGINVSNTQPSGHPAYSSDINSDFHQEAMEVYTVVKNLTPEQRAIAEFWSDDPGKTGTPPGHSISILTQVLEKEGASLALASEAYAKVGMSVHDAFISCWKCKYNFSLLRPVSYIREQIDSTWSSVLSTPPFPEYTSGHSVQAGAASKILTDLFGDNYAFSDKTHVNRADINGTPRSFSSFYAFADEAAISRLYGGIHYKAAIDDGVTQGKKIGTNISALAFKK